MRLSGALPRLALYAVALFTVALAAPMLAGCGNGDSDYGSNPNPGGTPVLNSGSIPTNGSFQHVFADSGSFPYHCTLHPCMTHGTVTVAAGAADSALVTILTPGGACPGGYTPLGVSVKPGGSVRWVNQSVTHTVTSD